MFAIDMAERIGPLEAHSGYLYYNGKGMPGEVYYIKPKWMRLYWGFTEGTVEVTQISNMVCSIRGSRKFSSIENAQKYFTEIIEGIKANCKLDRDSSHDPMWRLDKTKYWGATIDDYDIFLRIETNDQDVYTLTMNFSFSHRSKAGKIMKKLISTESASMWDEYNYNNAKYPFPFKKH